MEKNTHEILELLESHNVKATMFILGWVADRQRNLVKQIARAGHEIACHGYAHELITAQRPATFREDVRKAKQILEDVFTLEEKEVQLKRTYADKMGKVLPAWKVTRYMQIENKIRAALKFELARHIPLTS